MDKEFSTVLMDQFMKVKNNKFNNKISSNLIKK